MCEMCEVAVCPKCGGNKKDYAIPSPSAERGEETYYPPCLLCDGKGFVVIKKKRVTKYYGPGEPPYPASVWPETVVEE